MAAEASPTVVQPPGSYRMEYGDGLDVRFLFHKELDTEAKIRDDGQITIPGLGDFQALGLTADELTASIYRRASLTHRNPEVSVVVSAPSEHRVYIGGEVRRPGFVSLRPGMTSLRAIFERGGFLAGAKIDNVLHISWLNQGEYRARVVDLKLVLETGDPRGDLLLGPNDVVFVPKTAIANADLWVRQYIIDLIPIREPTTRLPNIGD